VVNQVDLSIRIVTHIMLGFAMLNYFLLTKHSELVNRNLTSTPNRWG